MAKFLIEPHFRLQEWVAEEKDYFRQEGLDYEFRELMRSTDGKIHDKGDKVGAYQSFEEGRKSNVSCACHWTVNVAASNGHGKMYERCLFGGAGRRVRRAGFADQGRRRSSPACRCRSAISRAATIRRCRRSSSTSSRKRSTSSIRDGMLFARMEKLFEGKAPAVHLFGGPYYFAEQLGYRKVIDCTFMIGTMIHGDPDPEDLRKFFRALRKAQRDIDLRPELYTHYYKNEFPDRFHARMDTRRWGPGERLVFEPYTKEVYEESFEWIASHGIFPEGGMGRRAIRTRDSVADLRSGCVGWFTQSTTSPHPRPSSPPSMAFDPSPACGGGWRAESAFTRVFDALWRSTLPLQGRDKKECGAGVTTLRVAIAFPFNGPATLTHRGKGPVSRMSGVPPSGTQSEKSLYASPARGSLGANQTRPKTGVHEGEEAMIRQTRDCERRRFGFARLLTASAIWRSHAGRARRAPPPPRTGRPVRSG